MSSCKSLLPRRVPKKTTTDYAFSQLMSRHTRMNFICVYLGVSVCTIDKSRMLQHPLNERSLSLSILSAIRDLDNRRRFYLRLTTRISLPRRVLRRINLPGARYHFHFMSSARDLRESRYDMCKVPAIVRYNRSFFFVTALCSRRANISRRFCRG